MVELADGTSLAYDKLLIATSGVPRTLDIPEADLPGVFFLRRLDDALALREHLTPGAPVVVIGAGFIGAEVAASARALGCEVTMLEIAEIPLGRSLGPEIGQIYADVHREHGAELRAAAARNMLGQQKPFHEVALVRPVRPQSPGRRDSRSHPAHGGTR